MPRLSPLPQLALLACAANLTMGCSSLIYRNVYAPRGNHFVRPVEKKIELPVDKKPATAPAVQGLPAAGAGAPAIPGLAPVPGMEGLPMPAP